MSSATIPAIEQRDENGYLTPAGVLEVLAEVEWEQSQIERPLGQKPSGRKPLIEIFDEDRVFQFDEVCARLGISRQALYRLRTSGQISSVYAPGVGHRIKSSELRRFIDSMSSEKVG